MVSRVTPLLLSAQTIRAAQLHGTRMSHYQVLTSTGSKINKPSDDPIGTRAIIGVRSSLARMETELSNITTTRQRLGVANNQLVEAQQILVKVKDISLQARQSIEPTERQALVQELDGLRDKLIDLANTRHNGEYLFGGAASDQAPFTIDDNGNVTYVGSDVRGATQIRPTTRIDVLFSGAEVFQGRSRQATEFLGLTGAEPGTGIDSATGYGQLQVIHTSTTYAAGSGVAAGSGSVAGDTVIGPAGAHNLTIVDTSGTGAAGTISLNGGPPIAFTNGDTNLQVTGPDGEAVFLDTTSITAGFSGTVAITANGALSVDGGATQTPIDFSANQQIADGASGAVTNVNSAAIRRTGAEAVDYAGTADVFQIVDQLKTTILDEANNGNADWNHAMSRHMEDIERMQDHILDVVGDQSVSLENLDSMESRIKDLQLEQEKMATDIEGADLADAVLKLQQEQTMLQYTLAGTARLFQVSLVDFL
ncbi:MAG: flagellar hook-associated protein FlgL [Planctomycetaceae bacterium]|nr:flagellar hook-associated protein FlgL [Planctomycetaceae bacterium]